MIIVIHTLFWCQFIWFQFITQLKRQTDSQAMKPFINGPQHLGYDNQVKTYNHYNHYQPAQFQLPRSNLKPRFQSLQKQDIPRQIKQTPIRNNQQQIITNQTPLSNLLGERKVLYQANERSPVRLQRDNLGRDKANQSSFKKQPKIDSIVEQKSNQMSHLKATLFMVFIGFLILILIVGLFYGILVWNKLKNHEKNKLEADKSVLNVSMAPASNKTIVKQSNSSVFNIANQNASTDRKITEDEGNPLQFIDSILNFGEQRLTPQKVNAPQKTKDEKLTQGKKLTQSKKLSQDKTSVFVHLRKHQSLFI